MSLKKTLKKAHDCAECAEEKIVRFWSVMTVVTDIIREAREDMPSLCELDEFKDLEATVKQLHDLAGVANVKVYGIYRKLLKRVLGLKNTEDETEDE